MENAIRVEQNSYPVSIVVAARRLGIHFLAPSRSLASKLTNAMNSSARSASSLIKEYAPGVSQTATARENLRFAGGIERFAATIQLRPVTRRCSPVGPRAIRATSQILSGLIYYCILVG